MNFTETYSSQAIAGCRTKGMSMAKKTTNPPEPETSGWVQPPQFGPPAIGGEEAPVNLEEIDFTNQPPVDQSTDLIFGAGDEQPAEDVPDSVPPVAEGIDLASDPLPPPPIVEIEKPLFGHSREPLPEPETIHVNKEEPQSKGPQIAYVNGKNHTDQSDLMGRLVGVMEKMVDRQSQSGHSTAGITPEQAAAVLITLLPEQHQLTIKQIAVESASGSLAMVIAGQLVRVADLDDLKNFSYNEAWMNSINVSAMGSTQVTMPNGLVQQHQHICEYCGHPFKPIIASNRQRFCCNACGNIAQGRTDEPLPHRADCSTAPGKLIAQGLRAAVRHEA